MSFPVIRSAAYILAHVPDLVQYGSKPARELQTHPELREVLASRLRGFPEARNYPPHQVFIGNMPPEALGRQPTPWYSHLLPDAPRDGAMGALMPQAEFFGLMRIVDEFNLLQLESTFLAAIRPRLANHPLLTDADLARIGPGLSLSGLQAGLAKGGLPIHHDGQLVGCMHPGHEEDSSLTADILLENLACKASGVLAMRHLLGRDSGGGAPEVSPEQIDYVINSGEEAVGDRYQRGAGNLAKAMAEQSCCVNATGSDVKAFCCSPVHSLILAASLVQAGVFDNVVVVGGGSLAKLGMKFRGHLQHTMPILEDVLAAMAFLVSKDDGSSPQIRLDCVGKHDVASGSSPQAISEALIQRPLAKVGLRLGDVPKYAVELHNPEITEPAGSGNVPRTNYRMIAGLAVMGKEIAATDMDAFADRHGMPGFSPTQGHIAAGVPYVGHALQAMRGGELDKVLFVAKGSLFLGMMTKLSDGMSFLLERNPGLHTDGTDGR